MSIYLTYFFKKAILEGVKNISCATIQPHLGNFLLFYACVTTKDVLFLDYLL